MILFPESLQRNNPKYPIADSNDIKGGIWTVDQVSELEALKQANSPKLKPGILAYVTSLEVYYQWNGTNWILAQLGGGTGDGIPVLTKEKYDDLTTKPTDYLSIADAFATEGSVTNNTYTTSINGTYIDILFSAIRSLQSEVARLKNTFYYGIQSYNGTDTASAHMILSEEQEEKEPLWAIDPEDLSEYEDYSIPISSECLLEPVTNLSFQNNYIEILGEVSKIIDLNFEMAEEAKQCIFIIADVKENANITINIKGESEVNIPIHPHLSRNVCNILIVLSRKIYIEDTDTYVGSNYIWIQVTDKNGNVINTGYIKDGVLTKFEQDLGDRFYVNGVKFNNINLYKCNFYGKASSFTNDDTLSSITPTEDFTYKAAHITIRSVANKDTLLKIKDRLLENELILVESEGSLYIKNKNQIISIGSRTTTDDETTTMTPEEILNILQEAGYITASGDLSSAKLNDIEQLTFVHSESGQKFNMKVNSDGKLIIDQNLHLDPDTWKVLKEDNSIDYTKRGTVGRYTLGTNYQETPKTHPTQIYGQSEDPKAFGDRVRFGSWYIPTKDQTKYSCSHDFIELANSGSVDYSLEGARLFLIKGRVFKEETTDPKDNKKTVVNYLTDASIEKHVLSGIVKAGSTYLIRCENHSVKNPIINIDSYDCELRDSGKLVSLKGVIGMILLNASDSPDVELVTQYFAKEGDKNSEEAKSLPVFHLSSALYNAKNSDSNNGFVAEVRSDLIDCVALTTAQAFRSAGSNVNGTANALGSKNYDLKKDYIVKDFFELDPSRQGYLSLTTDKHESTGYRLGKVNAEYLNLANHTISFPHSDEEAEIARFTPKASYENKTICSDKTPLNEHKPNMVSCFPGINMQTTRCFAWVSVPDQNEYVWIRKKGETSWNRFESYKGDQSEIGSNDAYDTGVMNRVKYTSTVINSVYKRMKGVFPGSNYSYVGHKCVVYIQDAVEENSDPVVYEYLVGATLNNQQPNLDKCSNIQTFTLYPKNWTPKVYLISDQQGFEWTEYQVWAAAAKQMLKQINEECYKDDKKFPVILNAGDCTQNGTRYNEWLDYYNAGYCLFDHLEQMNVVGNNDLANAYDHSVLGTGNDEGKSNPYYFHLVNCYELDNSSNYTHAETGTYASMWSHPLIVNGVYFPSTYYTYFDSFGYLMINSELTVDMSKGLFKAVSDGLVYNLYTGFLANQTSDEFKAREDKNAYSFKNTISTMLDKLAGKHIIATCHEMPFTVLTAENLDKEDKMYILDRSCNGSIDGGAAKHTSLVGSHMNRFSYNSDWDNDDLCWFSQLLQDKGVKLCLGGHKHSYTCTYPIYENPELISSLIAKTDTDFNDYHPSKLFITLTDNIENSSKLSDITDIDLYPYVSGLAYPFLRAKLDAKYNGELLINKAVTYFMVQATGYKLKSNKELPSVNQSFSNIRPKTSMVDGKASAHYSQESPMFATVDYIADSNKWGISLYRIVNIKETAAQKVTEFSSIKYSTKPMVTERLVLYYKDGANENYWYTNNETSDYSFVYTNVESDRCWGSGAILNIYGGTIPYSEYTLIIKA